MSKAVLLSIKPQYCELIASGKKTVEVRKTRPKLDTPFKVYIYCTNTKKIEYPEYWEKLQVLDAVPNKVSERFKYDKTFTEIEAEVDKEIERQQWEERQVRFDL